MPADDPSAFSGRPQAAKAPPPQGAECRSNVVLIGMPGVGKSTVGVLVAKVMGMDFLDTDVQVQAREGRTLQDIIDAEGLAALCRIEERYVLSLTPGGCVIATGGSVVYSPSAMAHLGRGGTTVHLELELQLLKNRLRDLATRGVVMEKGQSLDDLYRQRMPLYRKYAQVTVDCAGKGQDQVAGEIVGALVR